MTRHGRLASLLIVLLLVVPELWAETVRVVSAQVEVLREANAGGDVLGTAKKGTVFQVLGRQGGWVQVAYPIGSGAFYSGFIPTAFCEPAPGAPPSQSPLASPERPATAAVPPVTQQPAPASQADVPPPAATAAPPVIAATPAVVAAIVAPSVSAAPSAPAAAGAPAPTRVFAGAKMFIEDSGEFGTALSAALMEKKVPVVVVTNQAKADFTARTASTDRRAGGGEKVARILVGAWGGGDRYHATTSISNRDGVVVFAYNVKKGNFQDAANSTANELKNKGITR